MDGDHGRIDMRSAAVCALTPEDVGLLSAGSGVKIRREWRTKTKQESKTSVHIRYFISSLPPDNPEHLGRAVRGHWSVENRNHHKRDDSVWQEDRHRHRRPRIAQNLALTRNALLAIIPFEEKRNLPSLIADYQQNPNLAIHLIFHTPPQI